MLLGSLQSRTRYCSHLTRKCRTGVRSEEKDSLGDVLTFGPALQIFGFHRGNVRCSIDKAGGHGIDTDSRISSSQCQRACESLDSYLGAVVGHHVGLGKSGASEVDDCPAPGFLHVWEYCSRGQKCAQEVIVQFFGPIVKAVLDCELVAGKAPCQIDQNVDPSVFA